MLELNAIGDDELLYRKVPVKPGWYDPQRTELKPDAFRPRPDDDRGISVDRAKSDRHPDFRSIEEAAQGRSSLGYYIAVLKVEDLRLHGFNIVTDSRAENPGHTLITDLTYTNRKDDQSYEKMVLLAHKLVREVKGPFPAGSH